MIRVVRDPTKRRWLCRMLSDNRYYSSKFAACCMGVPLPEPTGFYSCGT